MEPVHVRSVAEEHLYIELHPCRCGDRRAPERRGLVQHGDELVARFAGPCPACGAARELLFIVPERQARGFGGPEPSRCIDPGQFLAVSDRWAAAVPAEPPADEDARERARQDLGRAIEALEEVLKFLPDGVGEVPVSAFHSAEGAELRLAEPGRFRRTRLMARLTAYRDLLASFD